MKFVPQILQQFVSFYRRERFAQKSNYPDGISGDDDAGKNSNIPFRSFRVGRRGCAYEPGLVQTLLVPDHAVANLSRRVG